MIRQTLLAAFAALTTTFAAAQSDADATGKSTPYAFLPPLAGVAALEFDMQSETTTAVVRASEEPYFGVVLLSLWAETSQYRADLPPVLSDFVVMGAAACPGGELRLTVKHPARTTHVAMFGQAVTLDRFGLSFSGIVRAIYP